MTDARQAQVDGDHYRKLPIQPFDYSMANGLDPLQHTIVKYVTRFRDKNGVVDLEKAKHCIDLLIAHETGGPIIPVRDSARASRAPQGRVDK